MDYFVGSITLGIWSCRPTVYYNAICMHLLKRGQLHANIQQNFCILHTGAARFAINGFQLSTANAPAG